MTMAYSTTIFASSVTSKPLSPIHWNTSVPLSVATVWKVMNGLAATAGNSCVAKISSPLYLHENDEMMSRGMSRPLVPWRKPDSITWLISVLISTTCPRFAFFGTLMRARLMANPSWQILQAGGERNHDLLRVGPAAAVRHLGDRGELLRRREADARRDLGL